jgi:queuine/archaeosine tRNA-ribosyltransferase
LYISKYQPYISKQIKKQFNTDISLLLDCCAIDPATYSRKRKENLKKGTNLASRMNNNLLGQTLFVYSKTPNPEELLSIPQNSHYYSTAAK